MAARVVQQETTLEIVGLLATGGMGEIFLGRRPGEARMLAIKRLAPDKADDPSMAQMFRDEARITALLGDHPNIVRFVEHGFFDGSEYLALELIEGLNLGEVMQLAAGHGRAVPPNVAAAIALGALEGLAHAHAAVDEGGAPLGLIHRDVSPANLVVTWTGQVKLLDFGVSKAAGREAKTAPGLVKGKLYFMAPEQLRAEAIDPRADLFSLGVVLYFLLTGRHPFEGQEGRSVITAMLAGVGKPPRVDLPDLPAAFGDAILRALEMDADARYDSAAAMAADLRASGVTPASPDEVARFLAQIDEAHAPEPAAPRSGGASWHDLDPSDLDGRAALSAIAKPYQHEPENTPSTSQDLPRLEEAPPAPAPSRRARLVPAIWGLNLVLFGVLAALWAARLVSAAAAPALVVDSRPPGATVLVDGAPQPMKTPLELSSWPGEQRPIDVRLTRPDHESCEATLHPKRGTVRFECRMRRLR